MNHSRATTLPALTGVIALLGALLPAGPAGAVPRGLPEERCSQDPPDASYVDRDEIPSAHLDAVDCLTELGVAQGSPEGDGNAYRPQALIRRDQMASFVAGVLREAGVELPAADQERFTDVSDGNVHAQSIRQLAAAGIVQGVEGDRYAPDETVRRDQMATFLIQAQAYEAGVELEDLQGGETPFTDVADGNVHAPSIEGAYELGLTAGTSADRYAPDEPVQRGAMASFLARSLDAMTQRTTVADRDGGALPHTVFTFPSESGRCFQVTSGEEWQAACDPATDEVLQLRSIRVGDAFTVVTGLVGPQVDRVVAETEDGTTVEAELVATDGDLQAFSSPILAADLAEVVAYAGDTEVARTAPDDESAPPFPADTSPDTATGSGDPVTLTDVEVGHHQTYDRVVLEVAGGGQAGWEAEYVEEATAQGSSAPIELAGDTVLRLQLTNVAYPPENDLEPVSPETRLDGTDGIGEVYVGTVFEGMQQVFVGLSEETPFRVFSLQDPARVVVDVVHPQG